jgi:hypothetical protein
MNKGEFSINDWMYIIECSYHQHPATWGSCSSDECLNSARGSGYCVSCATEALGELTGVELAKDFSESVKRLHGVKEELWEILLQKKN